MQGVLALALGLVVLLGIEAFFWWLLSSWKPKQRSAAEAAMRAEDKR